MRSCVALLDAIVLASSDRAEQGGHLVQVFGMCMRVIRAGVAMLKAGVSQAMSRPHDLFGVVTRQGRDAVAGDQNGGGEGEDRVEDAEDRHDPFSEGPVHDG